jgi:CHAD domain-containing protein
MRERAPREGIEGAEQRGPELAATAATAGPFLVGKLRVLDARLAAVVPRVLASAEDEEAVHDLRVALRRTRTILEVGRRVFGRFHAGVVRRALREVMAATGALRDDEVLLQLVASLGVADPEVEHWLEVRRRRERRLRSALLRAVRDGALERGRGMLQALLAFPIDPRGDRRLGKFARRAVDRARREVDRRRDARPEDAEALHELRIAYKRLRYTAETFAEALPSDLAALAQPAARLQGRLGDLHDVDVASACVRRARGMGPEARGALLAALAAEREARLVAYARESGVPVVVPVASPGSISGGGT